MGRVRHALHLLRRLLTGRPLRDRPLTEADRVPLGGRGSWRDPGHRPETNRAACGRPKPGPHLAEARGDPPAAGDDP